MLADIRHNALIGLCLLLIPTLAAGQGTTEVVRGRVRSNDAHPLEGAIVTVTGLQTHAERTARTNEKGVYTVLFGDGEGEYVISVHAIGFAPATGRARRVGDADVLVADITLAPVAAQLDTVTVIGNRVRPTDADDRSVGGNGQTALRGALFSLDPTDLAELAASVPGVTYVPDLAGGPGSFSVLGTSPDQNSVLVDGSSFSGSALPADAIGNARLATTSFDPGRGRFSGGLLSITTRRGGDTFGASLHAGLADPHLAWADPASLTSLSRDISLGGSLGGPIKKGKLFYFAALDMRRTSSDRISLLSPRTALTTQYGLSSDSIALLGDRLRDLGVPLTTGQIPPQNGSDRWSAFFRLDATPSATTSVSIHATGNLDLRHGAGMTPLGYPSLGNGGRTSRFGLQVNLSAYRAGFLDELRSSVEQMSSSSAPYVSVPNGTVRVGVLYPDGTDGLTSLYFGGSTSGTEHSDATTWETSNEFSWLSADSKHRLKFGQSLAYTWTSSRNVSNPFGTFAFQSLEDLANNQPAWYSRILSSHERSTHGVNGALWLGDEWRASNELQLEGGVRLDMARSGTIPDYNPQVDGLFGVRTDHVPNDLALSPRLGFSWTPAGTTPAALERGAITISGGVGAFRGVIAPDRIASMADATGLPNTIRQLTCVGDATPIPDWPSYGRSDSAIPSECLDGTAPVEFSTDRPSVALFDSVFSAPMSWRGNLQISGLDLFGWQLRLDALYSLGYNGESVVDLNLHRTPAFTLPDEADRPVFVSPASIVPNTGAIAPGASRLTERFGRVMNSVSDLRSATTQITLGLAPSRPLFGTFPLFASYTYTNTRMQTRGFDGSTAGDPFLREWTTGLQPEHQIVLNSSLQWKWFLIGLRANIMSGVPYTPMVAGDVNGDGLNDDRAFVVDPARASEPTLASQMGFLLESAPSRVRECLEAQFGHVAGRNSCRTGWQVRPDVNIGLDPTKQTLPMLGDRLRLSVNTVNAMGALLRVAGLSNTALGRLTGSYSPDPVLLYVDGFDPTTRRYRYRVNQQFGEARTHGMRGHRFSAPFQVQLRAEYHFGGGRRQTLAQNLGLVASDGEPPLGAEQVKEQLKLLTNNPLVQLLALRDSLLLTERQIQGIERLSATFDQQADSTLTPLAQYIVDQGKDVRDEELGKRLSELHQRVRELMLSVLKQAGALLTDEQKRQLPDYLREAAGDVPKESTDQ
jgi:hypothetical protein